MHGSLIYGRRLLPESWDGTLSASRIMSSIAWKRGSLEIEIRSIGLARRPEHGDHVSRIFEGRIQVTFSYASL